jgi:hypothetical protein
MKSEFIEEKKKNAEEQERLIKSQAERRRLVLLKYGNERLNRVSRASDSSFHASSYCYDEDDIMKTSEISDVLSNDSPQKASDHDIQASKNNDSDSLAPSSTRNFENNCIRHFYFTLSAFLAVTLCVFQETHTGSPDSFFTLFPTYFPELTTLFFTFTFYILWWCDSQNSCEQNRQISYSFLNPQCFLTLLHFFIITSKKKIIFTFLLLWICCLFINCYQWINNAQNNSQGNLLYNLFISIIQNYKKSSKIITNAKQYMTDYANFSFTCAMLIYIYSALKRFQLIY